MTLAEMAVEALAAAADRLPALRHLRRLAFYRGFGGSGPPLVVVGTPSRERRRLRLFAAALERPGLPEPYVVAWSDVLTDLVRRTGRCGARRTDRPGPAY
ncbi:hypothetical protein [Nonomuraea sp. NPDC049141]|uniref:hypothetical protein n=1 Tax=Nonomuraea sp. NPDC049141 TaxID=3155500 RepID=UPI00340E3F17